MEYFFSVNESVKKGKNKQILDAENFPYSDVEKQICINWGFSTLSGN